MSGRHFLSEGGFTKVKFYTCCFGENGVSLATGWEESYTKGVNKLRIFFVV